MLISFEFVCARARDLLIRDEPAAEVAQAVGFVDKAVGFVDQSHLIRRSRDIYGTTPGSYARESEIAKTHRRNA
jgi:AraC-like DNA-binding protein